MTFISEFGRAGILASGMHIRSSISHPQISPHGISNKLGLLIATCTVLGSILGCGIFLNMMATIYTFSIYILMDHTSHLAPISDSTAALIPKNATRILESRGMGDWA
jgi:hypothetical protein